jgi:RNA polymerase sigma factor (sigma-70 family)
MARTAFIHRPEAEAHARFAANQGLILPALNKFLGTGRYRLFLLRLLDGLDCAVQEARIALWRAALCYDPDARRAAFSTYYFRTAYNHLRQACRRCGRSVSAGQPISGHLDCPDRPHRREGAYRECLEILARMPEREALALRLYYLDGLRQEEVAARLGCLRKAAWARIRTALRHARQVAGVAP